MKPTSMVILGLDPGIARTGFGLLDTNQSSLYMRAGCLTTAAHLPTAERLWELAGDLEQLVTAHQPQIAVLEKIFFGANRTTAMRTAETRGVLLYVLKKHGVAIQEWTPLQIKSRLTGHGRATKHQVQTIITHRLRLNTAPQPDDAADALAAALCCLDNSLRSHVV